jgi:uncharacterized membrane protein YecN with MAPEG domain
MPAPPVPITAVAASLYALFYVKLAFNVVNFRRTKKVSIGSGGDETGERLIRAHGNMGEYAPMFLIQLGTLELNGAPKMLLAGLALAFGYGRWSHSVGIASSAPGPARRSGAVLTFGCLAIEAFANLFYARSAFGL